MKKIILLFMLALISIPAWSAQWDKSIPCKTGVGSCSAPDQKADFPQDQQNNNESIDRLLSNYREGLTISYSSTSAVSVSSGEAMVSNSAGTIRLMLKNNASTSVSFSDIDTGSEAGSTTYYIYYGTSTATDETGVFKVSASSTAPTGLTYFKRLGSIYNDSSSNISKIDNDNDNSENGDFSSKTANVAYVALTDGTVTVYGQGTGTVQIKTDSSSDPTTIVNQFYNNATNEIQGSISSEISKGQYWKAACSSSCTVWFKPKG